MSDVNIVTRRTPPELRDRLFSACRCAGLRAAPYEHERLGAPLVVSGLGSGERMIPSDLIAAAGEDSTLLLVAEERLVRPTVTLQRGRVVLMDGDATDATLESTLRMLAGPRDHLGWRSSLRAGTWCATSAPVWMHAHGEPLEAVIPFGGQTLAPHLAARAFDALRSGDDGAVSAISGGLFGLVSVDASRGRLLVCWPDGRRPLWFHAPLRLPATLDLAESTAMAPFAVARMVTEPGMVLCALSTPMKVRASALAGSGAALVEHLAEHGAAVSGLVVAVR